MSGPGRPAFTVVLHSHLPWVLHHGRWPHGVDWLNEAAAETYLPLWRVFHDRAAAGRPLGVTLGLTPVLCEQLAHPDFAPQFAGYLEQKMEAAREDRATFTRAGDAAMAALAERWSRFYRESLEQFMGPLGTNLVARFRRLEEQGAIEIITCAATHGYLPLLSSDVAADAQLQVARTTHRRHFGRDPRGIWLPECAYRPAGRWPSPAIEALGGFGADSLAASRERVGVETLLAAHGLSYFFVDSHLLLGGRALGVYAERFDTIRRLIRTDDAASGERSHPPLHPYAVGAEPSVACFGRDPLTAMQVWSGEHGYPGDAAYLDFHKKRFPGGHRYWSVTHPLADLADKQAYVPEAAESVAPRHADHFVSLLERTLGEAARGGGTPIVSAMFDAELFGHWWFEGPPFLAAVLDRCAASPVLDPVGAGGFLERHPPLERVALPEGSWGDGGTYRVWLNDETRWVWSLIHGAESDLESLAREAAARARDPLLERLMAQGARELLLLESSDWPFLITTGAARDYAETRVRGHAADYARLAALARRRIGGGAIGGPDEQWLSECEVRDPLFPDLDWRLYARESSAVTAGG